MLELLNDLLRNINPLVTLLLLLLLLSLVYFCLFRLVIKKFGFSKFLWVLTPIVSIVSGIILVVIFYLIEGFYSDQGLFYELFKNMLNAKTYSELFLPAAIAKGMELVLSSIVLALFINLFKKELKKEEIPGLKKLTLLFAVLTVIVVILIFFLLGAIVSGVNALGPGLH